MFENAGPQGRTYCHEGKDYQFEPILLSTAGQRTVINKLRQVHESTCGRLVALASQPGISKDLRTELVDKMYKGFSPSTQHVLAALEQIDILPTILTVVCPELSDIRLANEFVDSHSNVAELERELFLSCGLEELKNLHRLIREYVRDQAAAEDESSAKEEAPQAQSPSIES